MFRSKWPNYMGGYAFFVVRDIVQWNSSLTLCITQTEYLLYLELYICLEATKKKSESLQTEGRHFRFMICKLSDV